MTVLHRIQLVDLMKELNILGPAAEIGVAEGNFSRDLLAAGIPKLYMVDNWETIKGVRGDGAYPQHWHNNNYKNAKRLVEPYKDHAVMLKGMSTRMAENVPDYELSLLYLDANHSYEGVMQDLDAWYNKVRSGGIIAGHDYLNKDYGVNAAVWEFTRYLDFIEPITIPENSDNDASFYFIKP